MKVFLAPHNDDEVLFGSFTLLEQAPFVVVCLRSQVQEDRYGILAAEREAETGAAMTMYELDWEQWPILDRNPSPAALLDRMEDLEARFAPEVVYAPAVEDGGHDQHSLVGTIAAGVFGDRVVRYLTYRRGHGRSRSGREVVPSPSQIVMKHLALSVYRSQIGEPSCRPWFLDEIREWYA